MKKILVVYFSCGGVTKRIAEYMEKAGADSVYRIEPEQPYSDGDLLAANPRSRVCLENDDPSCRPAIKSADVDVSGYEVVVIGYPNWFLNAPKIVYTFLDKYNLDGKLVVPFCTSGGTPVTKSAEQLKKAYPGLNWGDGKQFSFTSSPYDVEKWLKNL